MTGFEKLQKMPATSGTAADFAKMTKLSEGHIRRVLKWMPRRIRHWLPSSLLDLASGPFDHISPHTFYFEALPLGA
jgi:hypothetical protein